MLTNFLVHKLRHLEDLSSLLVCSSLEMTLVSTMLSCGGVKAVAEVCVTDLRKDDS